MKVSKIKRIRIPENLTQLAYKSIRESILTGSLSDEDRLSEERFATELGISKSPIREALRCLAVEGLITISPRRGSRIVRFGAEEVTEIFDLREVLEVLAVNHLRVTPEFISALRAVVERCEVFIKAGKPRNFLAEDTLFHNLLVKACHKRFLWRVFRNLQDYVQLIRLKALVLPGRPSRSHQEHRKIVAAIEHGDLARAAQLLQDHIRGVKTDVLQAIQDEARSVPATLSGSG